MFSPQNYTPHPPSRPWGSNGPLQHSKPKGERPKKMSSICYTGPIVRTHTKNVWIWKEGLGMAPGEGFEPSRPQRTTGLRFHYSRLRLHESAPYQAREPRLLPFENPKPNLSLLAQSRGKCTRIATMILDLMFPHSWVCAALHDNTFNLYRLAPLLVKHLPRREQRSSQAHCLPLQSENGN
jgi:hypothetical protein